MRVAVASEVRLLRGPDGVVRAPSEGRGYRFWARYLVEFGSVLVVARVVNTKDLAGVPVEGPHVSVWPVTDYKGAAGLVRSWKRVRADVGSAIRRSGDAAYVARVPGVLGTLMVRELHQNGWPYALEVVGDPRTALEFSSLPIVARKIIANAGATRLRRECLGADAVSYVTRDTLQRAYPAANTAITAHYSSVELPPDAFVSRPIVRDRFPQNLAAVGTLNQPYKGFDILIDALARIPKELAVLRIVGSGSLRSELERRAYTRGVQDRVVFVGQLGTAREVQEELDRADIFVMPSRTEGLPRALIEAMARGLPCIASKVGGIPELLPEADMVPAGRDDNLARSLQRVIVSAPLRREMAERNLQTAQHYAASELDEARRRFYAASRAITERRIMDVEGR